MSYRISPALWPIRTVFGDGFGHVWGHPLNYCFIMNYTYDPKKNATKSQNRHPRALHYECRELD